LAPATITMDESMNRRKNSFVLWLAGWFVAQMKSQISFPPRGSYRPFTLLSKRCICSRIWRGSMCSSNLKVARPKGADVHTTPGPAWADEHTRRDLLEVYCPPFFFPFLSISFPFFFPSLSISLPFVFFPNPFFDLLFCHRCVE